MSRWDCDNVVIAFGPMEMDVTQAAVAAIELGRTSEIIWTEHLDKIKRERPALEPPPTDDGIPRVLEATFGVSTIIGGEDESCRKYTGTLFGVRVRERVAGDIDDTS